MSEINKLSDLLKNGVTELTKTLQEISNKAETPDLHTHYTYEIAGLYELITNISYGILSGTTTGHTHHLHDIVDIYEIYDKINNLRNDLNYYVNEINQNLKFPDRNQPAISDHVGKIRYRTIKNGSCCEMCMQTGPSTYSWEIIKIKTW